MNNQVVYDYKGSQISFVNGENVMVNATQMAKPFGKEAKHWLINQQTKDYIQALSEVRFLTSADLVIVKKGGLDQGTWFHEDVALEFARWLSPAFAIWCNDRIKELLKTGVATASNDDEAILHAIQVLQKRVDESKQRIQMLEGENKIQQAQIKYLAPRADYTDKVLQSTSTYTMTQVAKEVGMSAHRLGEFLREKKVMFRQSGTWMCTSKYQDKGYTKVRTHTYTRNDGTTGTSSTTVFTELGRAFIHSMVSKNN